MPQIKIFAAPPPPEPEPTAWPLSRLVQVTAYVAVLTFLTWLLPYPADAIASIGLFVLTMLSMAIYDRLGKAPSRDSKSKMPDQQPARSIAREAQRGSST